MIFLEHDHRHAAAPQDNAAIAGTHTSPKPKLKSKAKNKTARTPHAPHAFTQANNQRYHALLGKAIEESVHQLERLLVRRVLGQAVHVYVRCCPLPGPSVSAQRTLQQQAHDTWTTRQPHQTATSIARQSCAANSKSSSPLTCSSSVSSTPMFGVVGAKPCVSSQADAYRRTY